MILLRLYEWENQTGMKPGIAPCKYRQEPQFMEKPPMFLPEGT
jgi:hypothetical protein